MFTIGILIAAVLTYILHWDGWAGYNHMWQVMFGKHTQSILDVLFAQFFKGVTIVKIVKALIEITMVLSWILALYQLACLIKTGIVARFLTLCSRYSMQMYLLNGYVLVLTRTLLVSVLGISNPIVIILGNFVPDTILVLIISKYILDRWNWTRIPAGLRSRGKE